VYGGETVLLTWPSLALLTIRIFLTKLFLTYDVEYVGRDVDWHHVKNYIAWDIPQLRVKLRPRDIMAGREKIF
jgi:hypothetical protein